jgi:ABC-2 type transport system permease protein
MNPASAYPRLEGAELLDGPAMTTRRVVRAYVTEAKYESLRMLRSPAFAGPFLVLPAALYLLFGVLLYGPEIAKDPKAALYLFMGLCVFGVMGPGMFGFGVTLAMEREKGLLKLKRAMPMPPAASLIAKMLMSALFVFLIMISMALVAPLGHVRLTPMQVVTIAILNMVGSLPFCALGLFIGSLASPKSAPAFVNLLYLPMIYLSGILFPLPASMKWISQLSPAYHLEQTVLAALGAASEGWPAIHIAALAGVTLSFTALAVQRLQRAA